VIAHWSSSSVLSRSVRELIRQLRESDYGVVIVSTAEAPEPLEATGVLLDGVTILRRPNVGYDFGSWATGMAACPWVQEADRALFANDSMLGPFVSVAGLLRQFEGTSGDVWGLTDTVQHGYHLQSYVIGFRGSVLRHPPLQEFWRDIRVEPTKRRVVRRYELGLSALARTEGYRFHVAYPHNGVVRRGQNPTIIGWRKLLDLGFPFVKRELLLKPRVAPDGVDVPDEIERRFGVEARSWL
jgi:lipopolysaccharide biosynthesis protein